MRVCLINDSVLPEKIDSCDVVFLLKNPIPKSLVSKLIEKGMWLVRVFSNWINNLPCTNCIGSYFEFYDVESEISNRLLKLTKFKFEILQNKEFNIISNDEVCKFWIGDNFKEIPKNCDLIVVNDVPDERTLTQTRKKTNGNIELAQHIKDKQPRIVIYPSKEDSKLEKKKNCITLFATVANIIYIDI